MNIDPLRTDIPVLLLYNVDPNWPADDIQQAHMLAGQAASALIHLGHPVRSIVIEDDCLAEKLSPFDVDEYIVFNWCEEIPRIPHSSSMVAHKLEELSFVYTGADSRALLFSQDKPAVKERLADIGIPTPSWQVCDSPEALDWGCFPAIVKPAYEHCSFGITHEAVVHTRKELSRQVKKVIDAFCQPVLVEDFIDGREFHLTVVGNGRLQAFPIAEMDFSAIPDDRGRLCTYDSKFSPSSQDYQLIQLQLPASLSVEEKQQLESVAIAAYRATECRDYARLDIRERDGVFHVLDVNPNADISPDTSVALSAGMAGFSFGEFGSLLVNLAAHRHPVFGRSGIAGLSQLVKAG